MMNNKAKIFNINRHRFCTDGDGIRSLVFFKGCPLRCKYCANPQSWDNKYEAREYTVEQLYAILAVDNLYFQATNGGITFGGGEPLLQAEFIFNFIAYAPRTWNFWIETSLAVPYENIELLEEKIARFVVDIKTLDNKIYRSYTGYDLDLAKENLLRLSQRVGADKITVRVPYIPNFMTRKQQEITVKQVLNLGITDVDVFDYIIRIRKDCIC